MIKTLLLLIFLFYISWGAFAQIPTGFQDNEYEAGFDQVNGITFDASGRMFTWEKAGKVLVKNGSSPTVTLLNISDEVNVATDSGLKGFALDPNFLTNGFIYLMYDVDRYFLFNSDSANYDPNVDDHLNASIGRITRYTVDVSTFTSIVPNSRLILLGITKTDGFPFIHDSHNVGSLIFGTDGTLLASCGDSSDTNADAGDSEGTYHAQALIDGILKSDDPNTPENENENVGSWRAQMVNCLSGKIIRIDPATGDGIPSNPFYDATQPRAAKSRVWAMGLRNPFRITLKPNTGEHLPSAGNPGIIYVGEVGSTQREEINVVTAGGQNFGWPRFEGVVEQESLVVQYPYDRADQFSIPFTHKRAAVDFRESPARAFVNGQIREIGTDTPDAVPGINFLGGCSIGGIFYDGNNFPEAYRGRYFHANFNNGGDPDRSWIHGFSMNNQNELTQMHSFLPGALGVTCMAVNPINGYLYYASYSGAIREVKYDLLGNQAPVAKATQSVLFGVSPLTVQFDASTSTDPEGRPLTYSWDFGDGSPSSNSVNPVHTFITPNANSTLYSVVLTVMDDSAATKSTTLLVSVNNTPPSINSTSVSTMNTFPNTGNLMVSLTANVTDNETANSLLTYKWETALYHNTHNHPEPVSYNQNSSTILEPVPCDGEVYFYKVKLTVTDPQGLSTIFVQNIVPSCPDNNFDAQAPTIPNNLSVPTANLTNISLTWTPSTDNVGVVLYEIYMNGIKIGETSNNHYNVSNLTPRTQYYFSVTAKDLAGNVSNKSMLLNKKTLAVITQDLTIYGDALNSDWNTASSTISSLYLFNATQPFINTTSIKVTNPAINQALDLRYSASYIDTTGYPGGVDFWVYNEGSTPYPLQIQTFADNNGGGGNGSINVTAAANKWTHFQFEWSLFGSPSKVGRIVIRLNQTQSQSLYFDEIKLVHCAEMFSLNTGNWNAPTTWSCGRIPIVTDDIRINSGHTVTIPNGVNASLKFLYLLGTLNPLSGSTFNIYKF